MTVSEPSSGAGALRRGWTLAPIAALVAPIETANPAKSGPGDFFYVDIEAVDNVAARIATPKLLPRATPPSRARHVIRMDDVIISLVRPRLRNIAVVPPELDGQWASTAFCVCRPRSGIDARYLYFLFVQDKFLQAIKTYGDSPPSGHDEDLLATVIPVAPSNEQSRIADRIEELLTDLDSGVAALARVKRNLVRYRAAVLHAAVTGQLTAAWRERNGPPSETGEQLLQRILVERRRRWEERTLARYQTEGKQPPKGWRDKYVDPTPVSAATAGVALPAIPPGWAWATAHQLLAVITSGSRDWSPYYDRGTSTFIMAQNVRMGRLDLRFRQAVDPPPGHRDCARSQVEKDDLLVTIVGANTGDVCRVDRALPQHYVCQSVALMRPCASDLSRWLLVWFTAPSGGQRQFQTFMYGAGRPHLGFEHLEQTLVPLPSVAEQDRILEIVEEKSAQIDALEAEVARGLARTTRLRQAILKAAFEGRLVPQDPSNEPASVLLERIRDASATPCAKKLRKETVRKTAKT